VALMVEILLGLVVIGLAVGAAWGLLELGYWWDNSRTAQSIQDGCGCIVGLVVLLTIAYFIGSGFLH
jgi:hypothetical protein